MTVGALLFLLGSLVGLIGERIWSTCMELLDIYREQR